MLYGMANNNVIIPAERDGALYNFLMGGQDYVFDGIGDEFAITPSSTSFLITLGTGEGVVSGRHVTEETVNNDNSMIQLDANSSGYVVIRVDLTKPVGTEAFLYATPVLSSQDLNNGGNVHDLPLYQYVTNGSGVSTFTDIRPLSSGSNVACVLENGTIYVEQWVDGVKVRKQVGSLDPENLTATPSDVKAGRIFGGAGSDEPQEGIFTAQTLNVSPTTSAQTLVPSENSYYSAVAVKGIGVKANTNKAAYVHTGEVVVDLGSAKKLISIAFGGVTGDGSFSLQPSYSTNGSSYTNIGSAVGGNPTGTVRATNVTARYVRAYYSGSDQIQNSLWLTVVYEL